MSLDKILSNELEKYKMNDFSKRFINDLGNDIYECRNSYKFLISIGINDKKIAKFYYLIGFKQEVLEERYNELRRLGLSDKGISKRLL